MSTPRRNFITALELGTPTGLVDLIHEKTGDKYFIMRHGDVTFSLPDGDHMSEFAYRIADDPQGLKAEANARVDMALAYAEQLAQHGGLDGFALCSDYCFNTSPFLSPSISNPTPRASRSPSINPSTCSPNKSLHSA